MSRVLLIHGLGGFGWVMQPIARKLRRHGLSTTIWSYRSLGRSIPRHAAELQSTLKRLDTEDSELHLVTHSMGGIIVRAAVRDFQPRRAGRWVMLGPPNQGSAAARGLADTLGFLCPALGELSDDPKSYVNRLPPHSPFEVGVLAAEWDRVVARESTHLKGERDHAVVPCRHGMLPFNSRAIEQTLAFLRQGSFLPMGEHLHPPAPAEFAAMRSG